MCLLVESSADPKPSAESTQAFRLSTDTGCMADLTTPLDAPPQVRLKAKEVDKETQALYRRLFMRSVMVAGLVFALVNVVDSALPGGVGLSVTLALLSLPVTFVGYALVEGMLVQVVRDLHEDGDHQTSFALTFRGPQTQFWDRMTTTGAMLGPIAIAGESSLRRPRLRARDVALGLGIGPSLQLWLRVLRATPAKVEAPRAAEPVVVMSGSVALEAS